MSQDPLAPLDRPTTGSTYIEENRHPLNTDEVLDYRYMTTGTPDERQQKMQALADALGVPVAEIEAVFAGLGQP